jgi:hypothetical protein
MVPFFDIYDSALYPLWKTEGYITGLQRGFSKNLVGEPFIPGKGGWWNHHYFTNQKIPRLDPPSNPHYPILIEEAFFKAREMGIPFGNCHDVPFHLFYVDLVSFNMKRGIQVIAEKPIAHDDSIFEVIPIPWKIGDHHISSQTKVSASTR